MTQMFKMPRQAHRRTVVVMLASVSAGLAGCGGGNGESTAGVGAAAGSARSQSDRQSVSARDRWDLEMVRCFRGAGLRVDDPTPGDGFPAFERPANFEEISSRCQSKVGPPPSTSKASDADLREGSLALTRCLREKGYDIEDAAPGQAIVMRVKVKDADSDACEKAQSKK